MVQPLRRQGAYASEGLLRFSHLKMGTAAPVLEDEALGFTALPFVEVANGSSSDGNEMLVEG